MNHLRSARERPDKSNHEVNRVIRRQNAEVSYAGPKWKERGESHALLEIIFVCQNAAFRPPSCPRGINNASRVFASSLNEARRASSAKILPPFRSVKFSAFRCFRREDHSRPQMVEAVRLRDGSPEMIFQHDNLSLRMCQELQLFIGSQFVIERNQHTAAKENCVSRNQPF